MYIPNQTARDDSASSWRSYRRENSSKASDERRIEWMAFDLRPTLGIGCENHRVLLYVNETAGPLVNAAAAGIDVSVHVPALNVGRAAELAKIVDRVGGKIAAHHRAGFPDPVGNG